MTGAMLSRLAEVVREINAANGWDTPESFDQVDAIGTKLALVHSEVSEALEAVRHADFDNFGEELADVLIRVLDLADGLGVDLDTHVERKLQKNRERGYRHGGKRV